MRTKVFLAGVIIFVIGLSLIGASLAINPYFHGESRKIFLSANYTKKADGLYVTYMPPNLTAQTSDFVFFPNQSIGGIPSQFSLVPVSELPNITAGNVGKYQVSTPTNDTAIYYNNVPAGTYAFVEPQNDLIGFSVVPTLQLDLAGILSFVGAAMGFVGFVTFLIGAILKREPPKFDF